MTYTAGDTVVHPQHGTATVQGVVRRDGGHGVEDYLELFVETRSLKIMVPAAAVEAAGIRDLSTKTQAEEILALLGEPSEVPVSWSERNTSTIARIKSHDLDQVSMVVRDLIRHQQRAAKPLAAREKGFLDGCLDIVARELSLVLHLSEDDVKTLIRDKCLTDDEDVSSN